MKRTLSSILAVVGLLLAGCSSTNGGGTIDGTSLANSITNGIKTACGYQVTFDTATELAGLAASPFVMGSAALAAFVQTTVDGVCKTVKAGPAASARPAATLPSYGGVLIRGSFIGS